MGRELGKIVSDLLQNFFAHSAGTKNPLFTAQAHRATKGSDRENSCV